MKIKLLTLTTLTLSFLLSSPPTAVATCYYPKGNSYEADFSDCSCEAQGYKLNYQNSSRLICMDRNCVAGKRTGSRYDDVGCQKCSSGFYVDSENNFCMICPQGATCDGYIFMCPDGRFNDGSQCVYCHSSCKTCSGEKANNCTSCDSRAYLSGGQCVDCPANAVCDGSSYFSCATGYIKSDGECVKDEQEPTKTNTVNTCPSRMTLSSDGCCCVNK